MPTYTQLAFATLTLPDFASRGINFDFQPIEQSAQVARDVNGFLVDISVPKFQQYRLTISCEEMEKPDFLNVWPGFTDVVTIPPNLGIPAAAMLMMLVEPWTASDDEWGRKGNWQMVWEQVQPGFAS